MPKDNEELRKLIVENPNLPLVFLVSNDERCSDYGSQIYEYSNCRVATVYFPNDLDYCYDDFDDIKDEYMTDFADAVEYEKLSDEEYEKAIEKYIEENVRHYEAIVISVY